MRVSYTYQKIETNVMDILIPLPTQSTQFIKSTCLA